jgi:GNAT superfamily N-acetyltransferase
VSPSPAVVDSRASGRFRPRRAAHLGVQGPGFTKLRHPVRMATSVGVRDSRESDRGSIEAFLLDNWGSTIIVSRGRPIDAGSLRAKVAFRGGALVGLATFDFKNGDCELITLDSAEPGGGIGSSLLAAVTEEARQHNARRLWLTTSNDNLDALRFYQRRGMRLAAVHRDAIDQARRIKPSIPLIGNFGIAVHDEVELELRLDDMPRYNADL